MHSGLGLNPGHKYRVIRDPFLFDLVQQELIDKYGINTVRNGGLKAYTTIDPELQERAQEAVESCSVCYPEGGPAAGLASVDPDNGEIVALASTEGYATESQFNYAWQAHRQPGSSFKTFVLTTAIKQGIDPDTTYYDGTSPMTLDLPGGGTWTVNNAEPGGGVMSLDEATWDSVNVIFAQLDLDVGPENVTETAQEMGIEAPLESVPAEAIGGLAIGVTPLEMADAYATLANGGIHHDPTAISRVEFPDGNVDEADADVGRTGADRGPGLRSDADPRGRDHRRHRRRLHLHGLRRRGRQDRHLGGPLRRLVRRLHAALLDRGLGRPPAVARTDRLRRPDRRPDLGLLHVLGGERRLPRIRGSRPACPSSTAWRANTPAPPRKPRPKSNRSKKKKTGRRRRARRRKKAATKAAAKAASRPGPEPAPAPTPAPTPAPAPAPSPSEGVGGGVAAPTG